METYSKSVKSEILKNVRNSKGCCATSFLTAVLKSAGSLSLTVGGFAFAIESDNLDFVTICKSLALQIGVDAEIDKVGTNKKGEPIYCCTFDKSLGDKLSIIQRDDEGALVLADVDAIMPVGPCCRRSFLQGVFVASGSVVIPQNDDLQESAADKAKYHLELRLTDENFANKLNSEYAELQFRVAERKNHKLLYLKDSESVADFLVFVNATSSMLKLENVVAVRSYRNRENRRMNCTMANIDKTVVASAKQLKAIDLIRSKGLYDGLPDTLKDIIALREKYPEASLDEIADMLNISKSGANHRFAKLIEIAQSN